MGVKPVDQTTFFPEGNCWAACLASIFEVPLTETPDFERTEGGFRHATSEWAQERFSVVMLSVHCGPLLPYLTFEVPSPRPLNTFGWQRFHIIGGTSPRMVPHSVVGENGKMVHDPHPSRAGLLQQHEWNIFIPTKVYEDWRSTYDDLSRREGETLRAAGVVE